MYNPLKPLMNNIAKLADSGLCHKLTKTQTNNKVGGGNGYPTFIFGCSSGVRRPTDLSGLIAKIHLLIRHR